jgi:hypothetical protein
LDEGYFKWYPNFFIFLVAPPGIVSKSTTASIGMDLLREVPDVKFGPSAVTWQKLVQSMAESSLEFAMPDGLFMPMSAITIEASELGTFFDPRNREMVDVLVSLWDNKEGAWEKATKMDSDKVVNPWINIIGCTTPSWIAENVTDYFSGGGMASRSVFVFADTKKKLVAYPHLYLPKDFENHKARLINDLQHIGSLVGEFKLSKDALDWGTSWYEQHNTTPHPELTADKFAGYLARKQTHIHKLAMVFSVSHSDKLIITSKELQLALDELDEMEVDLPEVFGATNREREVALASDLLDYLIRKGKTDSRELYRAHWKSMSGDTYDKVIKSLIQAGLVTQRQEGNNLVIVPLQIKEN